MRGHRTKGKTVQATLRQLERAATMSPFSRAFYQFLNSLMTEVGANDTRLGKAFHLFLRVECRRHESAGRLVRMKRADPAAVVRAGKESHFLLDRLSRTLDRMEIPERPQATARDLLLAECDYHLGRTDEVIPLLQRVIRQGCRHPLVYFALGYNMYSAALQRFTKAGPRKGELIAHNPRALDRAFHQAIDAFEGGLADDAFDAQIFWWIGLVHEVGGEAEAACEAYEQALKIDPEQFGERVTEKLRRLKAGAQRSPKEAERLARLGPITQKDILMARSELGQPEFFHTFFPDPER